MARNDYGPLRDAHQKALDAAKNHAEPIEEPTRPEGRYQQPRAWTSEGGLVQNEASANDWARASRQARENAAARQDAQEPTQEREDQANPAQNEERGHEPAKAEMTDAKAARIAQIEEESRQFEEAEKARQNSQSLDRGGRSL